MTREKQMDVRRGAVVDLSHPLQAGMPVWPGDPGVFMETRTTVEVQGYRVRRLELNGHAGTHLDAPAHVLAGGAGVEAVPLERCLGPGVVLDVRGREVVRAGDLDGIDGAAFALLRSGHDRHWGLPAYYEAFPRLDADAARRLAAAGLRGVGLDWPSPDGPESAELPAHKILLDAGLVLVENLRGLERLPERGFLFLAAPLALAGGDGSPVRAFALLGCG